MEKYIISPEDCLVLLAVRKSSSLREAAKILNCDPAGLMRKVQRLSQNHELLHKLRGKWLLTERAQGLIAWTQESIRSQGEVLNRKKQFRIASTVWFAERVLIPELAFRDKYFEDSPDIQFSVPVPAFEKALLEGDCDIVIACHPPESPMIAHKQIMKEPWSVVISPKRIPLKSKVRKLNLPDLKDIPFIRHMDTNPALLLPEGLPFDIQFSISADNLIGIRAAVLHGLGWSIVPTALVSEELNAQKLEQVGNRFELDRKICIWWPRGNVETKQRISLVSSLVRSAFQKI